MNKDFRYYIEQTKPIYEYTIKLAVDDVDDDMLDKLETCLDKYDLVFASPFRRTPIQESPLDFPNVNNKPVYISEIKMSYPSTDKYLQQKLSNALGMSEQFIVVYTKNDPRGYETDLFLSRQESDEDYEVRLGKDNYDGEESPERNDYKAQNDELSADLETDIRINGSSVEADGTLPDGYGDYPNNGSDSSIGLFGRMNKKVNYGRS